MFHFRFLRRQGIKQALRIRHSDMLDDMSGKKWFEHVQHGHFHEMSEKVFVFGELMRVVANWPRRHPGPELCKVKRKHHWLLPYW